MHYEDENESEMPEVALTEMYLRSLSDHLKSSPQQPCLEDDLQGKVGISLGAGTKYWPGWINIDFTIVASDVVADLKTLPFKDNTADVMSAIHVVEHFYSWKVPKIFREWYRVLKPGGKIILELPCMDKLLANLAQCFLQGAIPSKDFYRVFFQWPLWGNPDFKSPLMMHKWGYTIDELTQVLQKSGFSDIKSVTPRYHQPLRDMRLEATK
jgi:SAM-dependent methyltransferase